MNPIEILELASRRFELLQRISSNDPSREYHFNDLIRDYAEQTKEPRRKEGTLYNYIGELKDAGLIETTQKGKGRKLTIKITASGKVALNFVKSFMIYMSPPDPDEQITIRLSKIIDGLETEFGDDYKSILREICRTEVRALNSTELQEFFKKYVSESKYDKYIEDALRLTIYSILHYNNLRGWFKENLLSGIINQIRNQELDENLRASRADLLIDLLNRYTYYLNLPKTSQIQSIEPIVDEDKEMRDTITDVLLRALANGDCAILCQTINLFIEGLPAEAKVEFKIKIGELSKEI